MPTLLVVCLLVGALVAQTAGAQATPVRMLAGVVVDSAAGIGIAGAEVTIEGTAFRTVTNEHGAFRIVGATGVGTLKVRRFGFRPESIALALTANASAMRLRLVPAVQHLSAVVVRAERVRYTGRLAGYYERLERRVGGTFVSRADIERERPRQLTELLQRVPGVQLGRARGSATQWVVRMRGRNCSPIVWLDGAAMSAGDVNIDAFSPSSLEGIELYMGASNAPSRYTALGGNAECGTILLWSRGPDTEPKRAGRTVSASELEELVTSLSVFTADQVDTPAAPDGITPGAVPYPASLRALGVGGVVIAEFVVDTLGRVEPGTFGVVSSTHPLFVDSARDAMARATFIPARRKGQAVRQLVRQPFYFVADARGERLSSPNSAPLKSQSDATKYPRVVVAGSRRLLLQ